MKVYLYLRKTEDWANVALDDCRQITTVVEGDQAHLPVLRDWNDRFPVSWQEFRLNLQEFTFHSWPSLPTITRPHDVFDLDDDDVIIPIDDDDWLSPDIEDFVRSEMRDNDLLQWTQFVNQYSDSRTIFKWPPLPICCTSDHALRVRVLKSFNVGKMRETMNGHGSVMSHLLCCRRAYIPECKSCYNRHIGSHSMLCVIDDIFRLEYRARRIQHVPKYASWAEPLIHWLDDEIQRVVNHNLKANLKYL